MNDLKMLANWRNGIKINEDLIGPFRIGNPRIQKTKWKVKSEKNWKTSWWSVFSRDKAMAFENFSSMKNPWIEFIYKYHNPSNLFNSCLILKFIREISIIFRGNFQWEIRDFIGSSISERNDELDRKLTTDIQRI